MLDPVEFFTDWASGALAVLPWVVAAVLAAVGLALLLLAIRKGMQLFMQVVEGGSGPSEFGPAQKAAIDGYAQEGLALSLAEGGFGYSEAERLTWFGAYLEERSAGQSVKGAANDAHMRVEMGRG